MTTKAVVELWDNPFHEDETRLGCRLLIAMDGNPEYAIPFLNSILKRVFEKVHGMADEAGNMETVTKNFLCDSHFVGAQMVIESMNYPSWYEKMTGKMLPTLFPMVSPDVERYTYKIMLGPIVLPGEPEKPWGVPVIAWKERNGDWQTEEVLQ